MRGESMLNKVILIGNVGRAPEMRFTASGLPITTFSVATSRRRRSPDGEFSDETEWHSIVAWEKLAERLNEQLQKGTKVYVEGRIQTRSWEGQDGQKRYRTEIIANQVLTLSPRPRDGMGAPAGGVAGADPDEMPPRDDEMSADDL